MSTISKTLGYVSKPFKALYRGFRNKVLPYAMKHKIISLIVIVALGWGGYVAAKSMFSTAGETRYVLSRARTGDVVATVTGTGQVSATNQIDLKPKASGSITYIGVTVGQEVKAGTIIAKVDTRDIDLSLASARISYEKLTAPVDDATRIQAENSVADAKQALANAETSLAKSYDDALTSISSTYVDLPEIVDGLDTMFYDPSGFLSDSKRGLWIDPAPSYRNAAGALLDTVKTNYKTNSDDYRSSARTSSTSTTETLLANTAKLVADNGDVLKNAKLAIDFIKDRVSGQAATEATTAQTNINTWTSKNNSHLSDLLSAQSQITSAKNALSSAQRDLESKTESLNKTLAGADALDVQSEQISLQQKQLEYENYIVRAPFDGIVAKLTAHKGDDASSGTSIGTFISEQKVANITLNEVDASKVAAGQPVLLTFDAVDGLTATGTIATVDLVGTVSQGVVTYAAQIAFDSQDDRIKPGMSVTAEITTENKAGVLTVPASAVKTKNGKSYVQVVPPSELPNAGGNGAGMYGSDASGTAGMMGGRRARLAADASSTQDAASTTAPDSASTSGARRFGIGSGAASGTGSAGGFGGGSSSGFSALSQTGIVLSQAPEEREVTIGSSNDTLVEIVSGLSEGEFVVSKTIAGTATTASTAATGNSLLNLGGNRAGAATGARTGAAGGAARFGGAGR